MRHLLWLQASSKTDAVKTETVAQGNYIVMSS
jgi:hypothetical protein